MTNIHSLLIAPYKHTFHVSKAGEAKRKWWNIISAGAQLGAAIQYMIRAGTSVVLLPSTSSFCPSAEIPVSSIQRIHYPAGQVPSTSTIPVLYIKSKYNIKINEMPSKNRAKQTIYKCSKCKQRKRLASGHTQVGGHVLCPTTEPLYD